MAEISDEEALLERIRAGEKAACDECIRLHTAGVSRLARRLLANPNDAEDLTQEAFLQAFRAIHSFEGRSGIQTWLYRITYNLAVSRWRNPQWTNPPISVEDTLEQQERSGAPIPDGLFDRCCLPEDDFESEERRAELEAAVRALPDGLRAVFVLRELEGLSTQVCAETLDISMDSVKQRLHRARQILRSSLSDYGPQPRLPA